jgi:hypothetical protein
MTMQLGDAQSITVQLPAKRGTDAAVIVQNHEGQQLAVLIMEDGKLHYYPADAQEAIKRLGLVP